MAIIDRKVMIPMSDGKLMAADIYRPKDESKKYGTIFVRTPYNFNYWSIDLGAPRNMSAELNAVKRGYAYVEINERGQYFLAGKLRHSGAAAQRRVRRIFLDRKAALVERQGRNHRMFFDRGMAVGGDGHGKSCGRGVCPDGIRRRRGPRWSLLRAGKLVSRRRGANAVYRLAVWRAEFGAANVSGGHLAGGSD